ncbi:MAG: DUF4139 domain-containing protein [Thermoguttaceae bacterium]|jgi:uncharacterized protein (TIGR02231 family)
MFAPIRLTMSFAACCALATACLADAAGNGEVKTVPGRVTHVTLYRGQALVTRTIPVAGAKGAQEIVVGQLPEQVVADSLFAEGGTGVEVRAVRCRTRAVGQEPRAEVRKLDDEIEQTSEKLRVNKRGQEVLARETAYLDHLETFTATTAKSDLARGVLDADALQKVSLFSFTQRKAASDQSLALEKEAKALESQLSLLQRRRSEVTEGAMRTTREAVLFVEKRDDAPQPVRLSYLVTQCGWSPAYTFRAGPEQKEVRVECNGMVHQMTGEDWNGVQLTLSTAAPALSASGPALAPFPVVLNREAEARPLGVKELEAQLEAARARRDAVLAQQGAGPGEKTRLDWALNAAANEFQRLELISGRDLVSTLQSGDAEAARGPSLSYALAGPVSVASRADQQMVQIFQKNFTGRFFHVATPVLTRHVYLDAELINTSDQDLLAGPIASYLGERFIGRGEIPAMARGQMFVPGFGADPQLRTRRELVDKKETVQGGNRKLDFKYRLIVENYKEQPALVRIYDRLPSSDDVAAIRVSLAEMKDPLDENPLYVRRERPKGILRWEITVPAGAVREKARTIEYGFSVEFDRNLQLGTLAGNQEQHEFEDMKRFRAAPAPAMAVPAAPTTPAPAPAPAPTP